MTEKDYDDFIDELWSGMVIYPPFSPLVTWLVIGAIFMVAIALAVLL